MPTFIYPPTHTVRIMTPYGYPANVPNPWREEPHPLHRIARAEDADTRESYIERVAAALAVHEFYERDRYRGWAATGTPDPAAMLAGAEERERAAAWWERVLVIRAEQAGTVAP